MNQEHHYYFNLSFTVLCSLNHRYLLFMPAKDNYRHVMYIWEFISRLPSSNVLHDPASISPFLNHTPFHSLSFALASFLISYIDSG